MRDGVGGLRPQALRIARILAVALGAWVMALLASATPAAAQAWWDDARNGIPDPSIATSLPHNGDASGFRQRLADRGVVYGLEYTSDVLSNLRGGLQTGTIYQGKVHGILTIDLEKLMGLQGLSFFANAFQIHNTGRMRRDYVGGINTIAAIEAVPTTRLSELWLEQKFLDGRASVRFGQLAADVEFFFSGLSGMFLQSDWPTITAVNLPSGGPAYPLSTPGIRFKFDPQPDVSLLFAVFNGDPAGPGRPDEEQLRNRYGLNFRVTDPPLFMGEAQWRTNQGKNDPGLARTLKLGAWAHAGRFFELRPSDAATLDDPLDFTTLLRRRGNLGLYAVIDQQLYRPKGAGPDQGISVFGRMSVSPSDRNLVSAYIDGGIVFAGLIPGRPDDKFGAAAIFARFSDSVRAFEQERLMLGLPSIVRDYEANLEFTYQAQIVPGWTLQPVLTRVWHPSGDASRNALVTGLRSVWRY